MVQEAIKAFEKPFQSPDKDFRKASSHTTRVLQIEQLIRRLRSSAVSRVLDFGCGCGSFLSMSSMYEYDVGGVDRSSTKRDNNRFAKMFAEIQDVALMAPFHALTLFEVL